VEKAFAMVQELSARLREKYRLSECGIAATKENH